MSTDIRNLAILAHVDAGKTTLSERILYLGRKISSVGEVEDGLATMDYLSEEKARGITIESGVATINWKKTQINFIDTPGHVDFGVEVDCALDAIDGAILVVSGIRNLQTQSFSAWNKLQQRQKPALIFINKLDYPEANFDEVLLEIEGSLNVVPLILTFPHIINGTLFGVVDVINQVYFPEAEGRTTDPQEVPPELQKEFQQYRREALEQLADFDEELGQAFLEDIDLGPKEWFRAIRTCMAAKGHIPIFAGSAKANIGVRQLLNAVKFILPHAEVKNTDPRKLGKIIKVKRSRNNLKSYLFYPYQLCNASEVGSFYKLLAEEFLPIEEVNPAELCALLSSQSYSIGEEIDIHGNVIHREEPPVYDSLLSVSMEPHSLEDQDKLKDALEIFQLIDPSLHINFDANSGRWVVSTVGEVHLEVLVNRLRSEYQCRVRHGSPEVRYFEEYSGNKKDISASATFPAGSIKIKLQIERSSRTEPECFFYGIHPQKELIESVLESVLQESSIVGFCGKGNVTHIRLVLLEVSHDQALIPGLLKKAISDQLTLQLDENDFSILEPVMDMEVMTPEEYCGVLLADLQSRNAEVTLVNSNGKIASIRCRIPMKSTFGYTTWMRNITKGMASHSLHYHDHQDIT